MVYAANAQEWSSAAAIGWHTLVSSNGPEPPPRLVVAACRRRWAPPMMLVAQRARSVPSTLWSVCLQLRSSVEVTRRHAGTVARSPPGRRASGSRYRALGARTSVTAADQTGAEGLRGGVLLRGRGGGGGSRVDASAGQPACLSSGACKFAHESAASMPPSMQVPCAARPRCRRLLSSRCQAGGAAQADSTKGDGLKARIAANFDQLFVTVEGKQYISVEKVGCQAAGWGQVLGSGLVACIAQG